MAKLTRQAQQIFAGQAPSDELAVFGSMKTGTPVYSDELSQLQSSDYQQGWQNAIIADKAPFLEEMNGVMYGTTYQLAYIFQEGIPEWDAETEYFRGSLVKVLDGNKIKLYMSLQDRNIGHLITDPDWWEEVYFDNPNKLNTDISNISEAGKKVFDGQWVSKVQGITTVTSGTVEVDLSEYLPEDEYNYEIMMNYGVVSTVDAIQVSCSLTSSIITIASPYSYSTQDSRTSGQYILPIGVDRKIKISIVGGTYTSHALDAVAYRRLGTNE